MEMSNLYMDTHKIVRLLMDKGYSETEAEGFIQAIQEITLTGIASKENLQKVEARLTEHIRKVETQLKEDIQKVETRLIEEIAIVNDKVKETKNDLTKLIYINTITTIGILTAVISVAISMIKF